MEKKYSTTLLFGCDFRSFNGNSNENKETVLRNSLELLSTVIKEISEDKNLSEDAKKRMEKFENIANYNKKKAKKSSDDIWNVEEFTILIIMMNTSYKKLYGAMNKVINQYLSGQISAPTEKRLEKSRVWLRKAYNCMYKIKFYDLSINIDVDLLLQEAGSREEAGKIKKQLLEIQKIIIQSGILDGGEDSIIGTILSKCAYPELLKTNQNSIANEMLHTFGKVIQAIESVESSASQQIAINEVIKSLNKANEDINITYRKSKIEISEEQEEATLLALEFIKRSFSSELDSIEKNTP